ncbi:MAG: response regulator [Armatimonadia bacterium]|nr:response regulator [Armatimonadia bacterium]
MPETKVLIVDDHALFRDGLRHLFATTGEAKVVADAASSGEALARLEEEDVDIVLLDYSLAGDRMDGIDLLRRIRQDYPDLPVMMVSMHAERHLVVAAAQAGAAGWVLKSAPGTELLAALKAAVEGSGWLSPAAAGGLMQSLACDEVERASDPAEKYGLNVRDCQILQQVAEGATYREVADAVHISESRVKALMRQICEKLSARGQAQATAIAVAEGLITPPALHPEED